MAIVQLCYVDNNVGSIDQKLRTAGGAAIGILSVAVLGGAVPLPSVLSPVLGFVSLVMIVIATVGTCPAYSALGVSSHPRRSPGYTEE